MNYYDGKLTRRDDFIRVIELGVQSSPPLVSPLSHSVSPFLLLPPAKTQTDQRWGYQTFKAICFL